MTQTHISQNNRKMLQAQNTDLAPSDTAKLVTDIALSAKAATARLATANTDQKNAALHAAAQQIRNQADKIIAQNEIDISKAEGLSASLLDRLALNTDRVNAMAKGLEDVAALDDPAGQTLSSWERPNGLIIERVSVPFGVIGIIYESRPNVTADAGALCLKSGNAAILRGGSESFHSSTTIVECLQAGLSEAGLPEQAIQLIPTRDRAAVGTLLTLTEAIDVIVPRGGPSLIRRISDESKIPVIKHLDGIVHLYLDKSADPDTAREVVLNSKMRRTSVCGALETVLVDKAGAATLLPAIVQPLLDAGCEVRGDSATQQNNPQILPADENDWATEYLDAIISIAQVDGVQGAIDHIARFGSHHTDGIIAQDSDAVEQFFANVDSAILTHNASTQFADGGEFGMGAEIGISTGKLPPRGPVGTEQLTTYKYLVRGTGQTRP